MNQIWRQTYGSPVLVMESNPGGLGRSEAHLAIYKIALAYREHVIRPETVLQAVERNVLGFIHQRAWLRKHALSLKKGALLYGPPGTGKSHALQYLLNEPVRLRQTVLLIGAEDLVCYLSVYFALARYLQPSVIVLEDVDLIAQRREHPLVHSVSPNRLLNEMDSIGKTAKSW